MIVTRDNLDKVDIPEKDKSLLESLLKDIDEFNELIGYPEDNDRRFIYMEKLPRIWISWQDYHNEYSPENLEAPDYYGCFRICISPKDVFSDVDDQYIPISPELTIDELDTSLCTLVCYFSDLKEFQKDYYKKKKAELEKRRRLKEERMETAKKKYENYEPSVGDVCMMIISHNEFYRISCSECTVVITEVNELAGPLMKTVKVGYVDQKTALPTGSSCDVMFGVENNPNMNYTVAEANDAFAVEVKDKNVRSPYRKFLFSKYQAIEIIEEWLERYPLNKANQYFWKSCKMKGISSNGKPSIKDHLTEIKNTLENYKC